jgi:hypothetical protein
MKKLIIVFGITAAIFLAACVGTGNTTSESTPSIAIINNVTVNGVAISKLDTLFVGDTLQLPIAISGISNRLLSLKIESDTSVSKITYPGIENLGYVILGSDSTNLSKGYVYFGDLEVYAANLTIQYVPKKPSKTAALKFTVRSTSQYSPGGGILNVPSKARVN